MGDKLRGVLMRCVSLAVAMMMMIPRMAGAADATAGGAGPRQAGNGFAAGVFLLVGTASDQNTIFVPARIAINQWVEKQTADKIKDLIKQGDVTGQTRLVLTNAIYFKGSWATPFKKELTRDEPFHLGSSDKTVTVPMMHRSGAYQYAEDD